ncbi:MAG: hypothetical protein PVH61_28590 [Candidatus Aminicenantes bacterium]|jgi:hypothetical protein
MRKLLISFLAVLFLTCPVWAAKVAVLSELQRPASITVDGSQVFITEDINVYIYSTKDHSLQKKFGKEGEGPQEFKRHINPRGEYIRISVQPKEILVNSIGKISYFTRKGDFIREMKVMMSTGGYIPVGNHMMAFGMAYKEQTRYITLNLYSPQCVKEKEFFRATAPLQEGKFIDPVKMSVGKLVITIRVEDNKMFYRGDDQKIYAFDENGNQIYSITPEYEKVKFTEELKNRYINFSKNDYRYKYVYEQDKNRIKWPDYFPLIRDLRVANKKIYVITFKSINDKKECYIYDSADGKFIKKVFIPLAEKNVQELYPYTIKNGKVYQLVENLNEEEWELHVIDINPV